MMSREQAESTIQPKPDGTKCTRGKVKRGAGIKPGQFRQQFVGGDEEGDRLSEMTTHQAIFDRFQSRFLALTGEKPAFRGDVDGLLVKRWLRQFGDAGMLARVEAFFDLPLSWWRTKSAWGFSVFLSAAVQNELSSRMVKPKAIVDVQPSQSRDSWVDWQQDAAHPWHLVNCSHAPVCSSAREHQLACVNAGRVAEGLEPYPWDAA